MQKSGRFRYRVIYNENLDDFASNDYLGLAEDKNRLHRAIERVSKYSAHAPKASMLVNGYHPIHEDFEIAVAKINGFEDAIMVGSGYLANIALIESLVRKNDTLIIDEEYHASGIMASNLVKGRVVTFRHNDAEDLLYKIQQYRSNRVIVAVEGIYSMSGDILNRDIFKVVEEEETILIVDEAHSSGTLGKMLLGVFDYYDIKPAPNHIKMGTLGKAYGSYGAYICASFHIIEYLQNRGKPIIYSTAPSIIDTALALENIEYVQNNFRNFKHQLTQRREVVKEVLGIDVKSQILAIKPKGISSEDIIKLQESLLHKGFLVGAIRPPTVSEPILRIILRVGTSIERLRMLLYSI